jgi:multisubunit Na+/H+ antiporter MnhG subunit
MAILESEREEEATNGAALASFLAAGIGAFALGVIVILNEVGAFAAPSLYAPAGGVTGRTALGAVIWLVAWAVMHSRWKERRMEPRGVFAVSLVLIALGVLLTFPPFWKLL